MGSAQMLPEYLGAQVSLSLGENMSEMEERRVGEWGNLRKVLSSRGRQKVDLLVVLEITEQPLYNLRGFWH